MQPPSFSIFKYIWEEESRTGPCLVYVKGMFESNEIPDGGRSDETPKLPSFSSMRLLSKGEYQVVEMGHL